jgi:hypothetical protein
VLTREKVEFKVQEEVTDAFGNTIKVKGPKKVCESVAQFWNCYQQPGLVGLCHVYRGIVESAREPPLYATVMRLVAAIQQPCWEAT